MNKSSRKILEYMFFGKPIIINTNKYLDSEMENSASFYQYSYGHIESFSSLIDSLISTERRITENDIEKYSWDSLVSKSGFIDD